MGQHPPRSAWTSQRRPLKTSRGCAPAGERLASSDQREGDQRPFLITDITGISFASHSTDLTKRWERAILAGEHQGTKVYNTFWTFHARREEVLS